MSCEHQNLNFHSEVRWLSRGKVLKTLYELRKEFELFLVDKKSDLSHYFQENAQRGWHISATYFLT
jgi:hypothetical protein